MAYTDLASVPRHDAEIKLDGLWRGSQLGSMRQPAVATGFDALDAELPGGGWPTGVLTEVLLAQPGLMEWRLLALALRHIAQQGQSILLLGAPHLPYAPALAALGIAPASLVLVQTDKPAERLWAVEQTLKCGDFGALLAWLPQARPEQLRRLQLAAQRTRGAVFLFRPLAAQFESSPAPLRLSVTLAQEQQLAVQVLKRRGPAMATPLKLHTPQPLNAVAQLKQQHRLKIYRDPTDVRRTAMSGSFDQVCDALDRLALSETAAGSLAAPHGRMPA